MRAPPLHPDLRRLLPFSRLVCGYDRGVPFNGPERCDPLAALGLGHLPDFPREADKEKRCVPGVRTEAASGDNLSLRTGLAVTLLAATVGLGVALLVQLICLGLLKVIGDGQDRATCRFV